MKKVTCDVCSKEIPVELPVAGRIALGGNDGLNAHVEMRITSTPHGEDICPACAIKALEDIIKKGK